MTILLLSAPRTGTNFAWAFLASCGLHVALGEQPMVSTGRDVLMYHASHQNLGRLGAIVPLRHPHECLASALDARKWPDPSAVATMLVDWWTALVAGCTDRDCAYLPLACPAEYRESLLDRVAEFAGARRRGPFQWKPYNASLIGPIKERYRETGELPIDATALNFAVEWYDGRYAASCS